MANIYETQYIRTTWVSNPNDENIQQQRHKKKKEERYSSNEQNKNVSDITRNKP